MSTQYRDLLIAIAAVNGHPEPTQYADEVEGVLTNATVVPAAPASGPILTPAPYQAPTEPTPNPNPPLDTPAAEAPPTGV